MRSLIIILIVFGQTGCLLAPPRPGGNGNDDCQPTGATLGITATAALEGQDSDTLIRAANIGDDWYLYFYPSTAKTSLCPERTFKLTGEISSVNAVEPAIVTGTDPDVLALVSFNDGSSGVIDVRSAKGELSEVGRVVASNYQPTAIQMSSSPVATGFIALRTNDQIWFGGGREYIAIATAESGIHGAAMVASTGLTDESWYHAVAVHNPRNGMSFALVGASGSYKAMKYMSAIAAMFSLEHGDCETLPPCHPRLAHTLPYLGSGDTLEGFSIDRTTGELETIESESAGINFQQYMPLDRGHVGAIDAAIGAIGGDARTDVVMLRDNEMGARDVILYESLLVPNAPIVPGIQERVDAKLNRVEILRTSGERHILLLADDPHETSERCLHIAIDALENCP